MSQCKKETFDIGNMEFAFDYNDPYYLSYKEHGAYEGCKVESKWNLQEIKILYHKLSIVINHCKNTIRYKDREFTIEDIKELNRLVEERENECPMPF